MAGQIGNSVIPVFRASLKCAIQILRFRQRGRDPGSGLRFRTVAIA